MTTIHDLSRHLRLSIGTISRALNNRPDVSAETRARVLAAARTMNYAPNHAGRMLRRGRTGTVAFVMSPHPALHYAQPFFFETVAGAQEVFSAHGLDLVLALGKAGAAQIEQLRHFVETRWTDAILIASTLPHDPRIAYLLAAGIPFATLGRSRTGGARYPSLDADFDAAGYAACRRLIAQGHRRIATVSTSEKLNYHRYFSAGCRRAFRDAGMEQPATLSVEAEPNEMSGFAVMQRLLRSAEPPSAAVFVTTVNAPGAYRAIAAGGLRVGADVAVIAANGSPLCDLLDPPLASFRPDLPALGRRWAEILLASWPDHAPEPRVIREVVPMRFVPGASEGRSGDAALRRSG